MLVLVYTKLSHCETQHQAPDQKNKCDMEVTLEPKIIINVI